MKKLIVLVLVLSAATVGFAQKAGRSDSTHHATVYTCPMHTDVVTDKAGKCPKCGMALTVSEKEKMKMKEAGGYCCPMHPDAKSDKPGKCPKCGMKMSATGKEKMKMEAMKEYTCPMHPDIKSDKAGTCSKCGMKLTETERKEKGKS